MESLRIVDEYNEYLCIFGIYCWILLDLDSLKLFSFLLLVESHYFKVIHIEVISQFWGCDHCIPKNYSSQVLYRLYHNYL